VVTPYGLVAGAVLNCSKKRFSYDHLRSHLSTYMDHLVSIKSKLSDTLITDQNSAFDQVLETFVQRKLLTDNTIEMGGEPTDVRYKVNENKRPILEYYKNSCLAPFVSAAFTALAILEKDAFLFSTQDISHSYSFLSDFFINDFSRNTDRPNTACVRKNLKSFIDNAIIIPHPKLPDTYNLTSAGFRKLQFFSNFLKTYFESYWIALNYFIQTPQENTTSKDRIKKIQSIGAKMYKNKEIERVEALSKITYINADQFFTSKGIKGSENKEKITLYADAIQKYLNYLSS
jgi:glycerol-3-phosphate O-acyltransferase